MQRTFYYEFLSEVLTGLERQRCVCIFFTLSGMIEGVGDLGACSFASPHPVYDHLFGGFFSFGDPIQMNNI